MNNEANISEPKASWLSLKNFPNRGHRCMTKIFLLFLMAYFVVLICITPLANAGGTYYVSHWNEEIVIDQDASITVFEEVTFRFVTGDFGFAYRTIPHRGFDDMVSITVTDNESYVLGSTLKKGNNYEVRWEWERIYVGSEPIEKTFFLYYTLTNVINYENTDPDRDRLYLNIVTDYDVDISDMNIEVTLPAMYNLSSVSATSYYSISATNPPETANSTTHTIVNYHQSMVEAREDYTLDIYFPATVERPPPTMLQTISTYLHMLVPWYSIGMVVLGIGALVKVISFKRRFRDPEVTAFVISGNQPPSGVRAAEAGVLSDMKVSRKHFDSALIDLAQRGYVDMYVESMEKGFFRKSVEVESFEVTLSEKGNIALQSEDPDLRTYELHLLNAVKARPLDKTSLYWITSIGLNERFGLAFIKDELIKKGLVDPKGFEKKGRNLMILGIFLGIIGIAIMIFSLILGSANWWMNVAAFFPAIVFGLAQTTGPRTVQGVRIYKQTNVFLKRKMKELYEKAKSAPLSTIQNINELAPWLILNPTFYGLLRAPAKAMKGLDITDKQLKGILPSYMKMTGSEHHTLQPYLYYYSLWVIFFATASPSTGAPPSGNGGGGGGGAGGGAGGGGGGAG